jgi:hypothetical protein
MNSRNGVGCQPWEISEGTLSVAGHSSLGSRPISQLNHVLHDHNDKKLFTMSRTLYGELPYAPADPPVLSLRGRRRHRRASSALGVFVFTEAQSELDQSPIVVYVRPIAAEARRWNAEDCKSEPFGEISYPQCVTDCLRSRDQPLAMEPRRHNAKQCCVMTHTRAGNPLALS